MSIWEIILCSALAAVLASWYFDAGWVAIPICAIVGVATSIIVGTVRELRGINK